MKYVFLSILFGACSVASASTLVGNPSVRLPWWWGDQVLSAPVHDLPFVFEGVHGEIKVVYGPQCDLAAGCAVLAPFASWTRLTVTVPPGVPVTTTESSFNLAGPTTIWWTNPGAPDGVNGPAQGLAGAQLTLQ